MADSGREGKGKKATGRDDVLEKITIAGSEANKVDAKGKIRYKPFALPS
jgi:hypothetical protein